MAEHSSRATQQEQIGDDTPPKKKKMQQRIKLETQSGASAEQQEG